MTVWLWVILNSQQGKQDTVPETEAAFSAVILIFINI
jgi:hypothetical protein